jgi:D-alanyl-D-alanine carboxypeptidase
MLTLPRWPIELGSRIVLALGTVSLTAGALSGCALGLSDPSPPAGSASLEELEAYVREAIADSDPPSISLAVSQGTKTVYERAFGYADGPKEIRATPETTYRWFSVTKPFTAVAVLQLAEEGKLSLSAPAATYLPYLTELYGDDASQITIERLLTHRAGIGDVGDAIMSWVHVEGHHDQSKLLRERLPEHAHFDPEQLDRGHYSNLGYMILGAVIESVSSESYEDYITRHILAPLRLARTHFYYEEPFEPGTLHAVGSHPDDFAAFMASFSLDLATLSRECSRRRWWFEYFSPDQTPPSGLISTSADMVRFGRMILGRGVLDGQRILTEATVLRMTEVRVPVTSSPAPPGFSFGESWFITHDARGRRMLMHGGQGMAFTSLLMIRPDDELVAAIVANGSYFDGASGLNLMTMLGNMDWGGGR